MKKLALALLALASSASLAAAQDWKAEWERTVAAAEQEGTVIVDTVSDKAWQDFVVKDFPAAFPKIKLDATRLSPPDFVARVRVEREAGKFLWDVAAAGPNPMYALYKDGAVDPILPELILPEAKDEAAWGGWDDGAGRRLLHHRTGNALAHRALCQSRRGREDRSAHDRQQARGKPCDRWRQHDLGHEQAAASECGARLRQLDPAKRCAVPAGESDG
jgi:hypothetical protein